MDVSLADIFTIHQVWDYWVYTILFLQIITLFFVFNSSLRDVVFIAIPLIAAVADKGYIFGYLEGGKETVPAAIKFHTEEAFATYVARVMMFTFPLMLTTQTKIKRAKPMTVVLAIVTGFYVAARWGLQQLAADDEFFRSPDTYVAMASNTIHAGGLQMGLLWFGLRRYLTLGED